ncbi:F420H2 dehydrogenase, subunit FpoO [Methanosalsum zhilinae DSM 4017]|uniref:F420H2 dehydrogenase, subunit FpoO n=1 Tax=Methanosalsum zhilinae (strain DSM 4017 / NBRC 107636 / OCM 62 / WeN5) TaxID=679901 RepID=F7XPK1_METZD|nr:F420H2 dehydrogenase subunit FpoO [Methanosalsum zhilinae]AEH61427.1 F420H2 dehydrogenase, subunit FpoO [Methanosalsum zhilinae DSM 4017]
MTDCDLCGVALPTLNNVKVFAPEDDDKSSFGSKRIRKTEGQSVMMPRYTSHAPLGVWAGLCDKCLRSASEAAETVLSEENKSAGTSGTCEMCGARAMLFEVDIEIPSFSRGSEPDSSHICASCLEACREVYEKMSSDGGSGHH